MDKEVTFINKLTLIRLFDLCDGDGVALYLFYIKTAFIQKTNSIWAKIDFCKEGMGWGERRVISARKCLIKNGFISIKKTKSEDGGFGKQYIKLNFFYDENMEKPQDVAERHLVNHKMLRNDIIRPRTYPAPHLSGPAKCRSLNAYNIKDNAYNKKGNALDKNLMYMFVHWNDKKIVVHKQLKSVKQLLKRASVRHSTEQIIKSIDNYSEIYHNEDYYFNHKYSLKTFLLRGLSPQGVKANNGYLKFLDENKPFDIFKKGVYGKLSKVDTLRKKFIPVTSEWDKINVLNKNDNTYYGFPTDELRSSEHVADLKSRVIRHFKNNNMKYGYLEWLELCIASMFFNRRHGIDEKELEKLMYIWENYKDKEW